MSDEFRPAINVGKVKRPALFATLVLLSSAVALPQTLKVLHNFTGGADGGTPYAGVIRDSAGSLYGTTYFGGSNLAGVVYKVDTSGHERVVYTFTGVGQNAGPIGGVVGDSAGNLYGTTSGPSGVPGMGMVYNTTGVQTVLYSFSCATGCYPEAGIIRDAAATSSAVPAWEGLLLTAPYTS